MDETAGNRRGRQRRSTGRRLIASRHLRFSFSQTLRATPDRPQPRQRRRRRQASVPPTRGHDAITTLAWRLGSLKRAPGVVPNRIQLCLPALAGSLVLDNRVRVVLADVDPTLVLYRQRRLFWLVEKFVGQRPEFRHPLADERPVWVVIADLFAGVVDPQHIRADDASLCLKLRVVDRRISVDQVVVEPVRAGLPRLLQQVTEKRRTHRPHPEIEPACLAEAAH
ncbi:MAG: hypothetical protein A07HN63_00497 [uncultured archaeon A07HN63]|nr:MAG: hypothetical protein A07HN63_00497 [uncultured archaeon A07HN63]